MVDLATGSATEPNPDEGKDPAAVKRGRAGGAQVLHCLMEGNAIRATTRLTGVSKTTILKLIEDAGQAAAWYQDRVFQNVQSKRIQVDEIFGFVGSKPTNTSPQKKKTGEAGECWVWLATDADTKIVPCWYVGSRGSDAALVFLDDLASRLADRVQLTSDSHPAYANAVEAAFGADVDYGQIVKIFGQPPGTIKGQQYVPPVCIGMRKSSIEGRPDPKHISTSYAERNNLNIRMHSRRMTRLTNAFSKKVANHRHAMAMHFLYYNFVRVHQTLKISPAMAAGITKRLWEMSDVVGMLEAWEKSVNRRLAA